MKENRLTRITELLDKRQPDLTVFMDNVHKPHNLAAVIRTCDAVGIGEVHAVHPMGAIHQCGGTAMGSNRWVKTNRYSKFQDGIEVVKAQGMQILAAHLSDEAVDFREIDYTKPTCIIVGAEKFGVGDEAVAAADKHIIIPMLGMVQSLNVSVAAAVVLYEAQRQREAAGLYNETHLPKATYERLKFEWLHAEIRDFCDRHELPYPKINGSGDIDDDKWQQLRRNLST